MGNTNFKKSKRLDSNGIQSGAQMDNVEHEAQDVLLTIHWIPTRISKICK